MALRSYSVLYILLPTIIIIIQECSQALELCKCLWSLSCGGVPNMLLVLSIIFHFHWYIWGCICSTGPFQFKWLRGYIHNSCYYHHQIGRINLTHYHILPWLCAWDVCYIISCHLLRIHSGKTGILFHYYYAVYDECKYSDTFWLADHVRYFVHYTISLSSLCKLIWGHWTYKMPVRYILSSVSKVKHIFSVIDYTIHGAVCFQFTHFPCDDWENIHFVLLSSSYRKYELLSIV